MSMFYEHRKVVNALYSKDVSPLKRNLVANYNSSVDDLFNHFIGYLDASPNTVSTYKRDLQQWFNYVTENHINQPTRNTVLQYRKYLVDNGKKNTTVTELYYCCEAALQLGCQRESSPQYCPPY